MDMPELNRRIKQVIDNVTNGNVAKFASSLKISQQKLNRLFIIDSRTNKYPSVPSEILVSISEMFVFIDVNWLLSGKGEMLKKGLIKEDTVIMSANEPKVNYNPVVALEQRLLEMETEMRIMREFMDKILNRIEIGIKK